MDSSTTTNICREIPMCQVTVSGTIGNLKVTSLNHKQNNHEPIILMHQLLPGKQSAGRLVSLQSAGNSEDTRDIQLQKTSFQVLTVHL